MEMKHFIYFSIWGPSLWDLWAVRKNTMADGMNRQEYLIQYYYNEGERMNSTPLLWKMGGTVEFPTGKVLESAGRRLVCGTSSPVLAIWHPQNLGFYLPTEPERLRHCLSWQLHFKGKGSMSWRKISLGGWRFISQRAEKEFIIASCSKQMLYEKGRSCASRQKESCLKFSRSEANIKVMLVRASKKSIKQTGLSVFWGWMGRKCGDLIV